MSDQKNPHSKLKPTTVKVSNLFNKAINFWKNDLPVIKIKNSCCCNGENNVIENIEEKKMDLLQDIKLTKNKKINQQTKTASSDIFKILKKEEIKEKKKYNDWTVEEDRQLLKLMKGNLIKKWKKISTIIGNNKTPRMCAYRVNKLMKYFYVNNDSDLGNIKTRRLNDEKYVIYMIHNQENIISKDKSSKSRRKYRRRIRARFSKLKDFKINETIFDLRKLSLNDQEIQDRFRIESRKNTTESKNSNLTHNSINDLNLKGDSNKSSQNNVLNFFPLFSRKNSPEFTEYGTGTVASQNKEFENKNEFRKAYFEIFRVQDVIEKFDDVENNENFEKISENLKYNENFSLNIAEQAQKILNSDISSEEKNMKLSQCLVEINNLSKILGNNDELKRLILVQARILESMIQLNYESKKNFS